MFECESCPVAEALAELDADSENAQAWRLFQQAVNRFTVDTASVTLVLDRLTLDWTGEAFTELVERFTLLYDALNPPPDPEKSETDHR